MKCYQCNREVKSEWDYCPYCNAKLKISAIEYVQKEVFAGKQIIRLPISLLKNTTEEERQEIKDYCIINEVKLIIG